MLQNDVITRCSSKNTSKTSTKIDNPESELNEVSEKRASLERVHNAVMKILLDIDQKVPEIIFISYNPDIK